MLAEGIPAAVIENAARQAGMPVGPLAVIDETSMSLSVHVMEQTIADLKAEGKPLPPSIRGQEVIVRMVKEIEPARAARPAAASTSIRRTARNSSGRSSRRVRQARRHLRNEELKDRILYRQSIETARCLEEGVLSTRARREHRLDLRHRFPGMDRRRAAVHQSRRRGEIRQAGGRAGEEVRRAVQGAENPARQGGEAGTVPLTR